MKRLMTTIFVIAVLLAPCIAQSDSEHIYLSKYYNGPDLAASSFRPTDSTATQPATWPVAIYGTTTLPAQNITVQPNQVLVLALSNWYWPANQKHLEVWINHAVSAGTLVFQDAGTGTPARFYNKKLETDAAGVYHLELTIYPQPNYEWVRIKNTSLTTPVVITNAAMHPVCTPIPSLTLWGVVLLVILLAGTAVWIVRKRRPALSM